MTIRPIDMQTLIPRASEVSRVQHIRESQTSAQQQIAQAQVRVQAEQSQRQVMESRDTAQGTGVHPDGRGRSAKEQTPRRRSRGKADTPNVVEEPGKGRRLDIKL